MSRKSDNETVDDIEICRDKIEAILNEYNCEIQTDDYHSAWLYDNDTNETLGFRK